MRFWSRRSPVPDVNHGSSYLRRRDGDLIETAKVIAVSPDAAGIVHVHFNLKISGPRISEEEQRTLSLEYFHRLYGEAVTA
jgi:hypothetical protein